MWIIKEKKEIKWIGWKRNKVDWLKKKWSGLVEKEIKWIGWKRNKDRVSERIDKNDITTILNVFKQYSNLSFMSFILCEGLHVM